MPGVVGSRMQGCFQVKHDVFFLEGGQMMIDV